MEREDAEVMLEASSAMLRAGAEIRSLRLANLIWRHVAVIGWAGFVYTLIEGLPL